jgi:nucleotide-binding universal stress UspA family protein
MPQVKQILVPTDFSPASDIAFGYALDLAAREGAAIHLLHVLDAAGFAAAYPDGLYVELPALREESIQRAKATLDDVAKRCAAVNVVATTEVLVGAPAGSITAEANVRGSDLIVMGTHGRGAFAHFVLGSVAEKVVRTAQCPVLTVRDTSRAATLMSLETVSQRPHAAA